jgi:hypothetical protein
VDDSQLKARVTVNTAAVADGTSNTVLLAERPPPPDGQWGWWDSACCYQDVISAVRGDDKIYSSGRYGNCPNPAPYQPGKVDDNCAFNAVWAFHQAGGQFALGDGSVRVVSYRAGNQPAGGKTLLEACATRAGGEAASFDP